MPATPWQEYPIGPCQVVFNGTSLGHTLGGVKVMVRQNVARGTADATGDTTRQKVISGEEVKVNTALTETTMATLKSIIAGSTEDGDVQSALSMLTQVGRDLVTDAKMVILKPLQGETAVDDKDWIYVPKASITLNAEVNHHPTEKKVVGIEIEGHPVLAADLASGGFLNAVTPAFVAGELLRFGTQTDS